MRKETVVRRVLIADSKLPGRRMGPFFQHILLLSASGPLLLLIVLPRILIPDPRVAGISSIRVPFKYPLEGPFTHPTLCFSFLHLGYHIPFLFPLSSWLLCEVTLCSFSLLCFCFPNGQYNVKAVTRNLSSLFSFTVPISRTIPGT